MSFTPITSTSQLDHFLTAYQASDAQLVVRRDKATNKDILGFTSKLTFGEKFLRLFGAGGSSLKKIASIEFAKKSGCFSLLIEKHNLRTRFGRIDSNTATLYKTDPKFRETFIQAFNRAVVGKNLPKAKLNQLYKLNAKMEEWNKEINAAAISAIKQSKSTSRPASLSSSQVTAQPSVTTGTPSAVSTTVTSILGHIESPIGTAETIENQSNEESSASRETMLSHDALKPLSEEEPPFPQVPEEDASLTIPLSDSAAESLVELSGDGDADSAGEIPPPPEGGPEAVVTNPGNWRAREAERAPEHPASSGGARSSVGPTTRLTADALQAEIERRSAAAKKKETMHEASKPQPRIRDERSMGGAMRQSAAFAKAQQLPVEEEKGVEGASEDEWDKEDEEGTRALEALRASPAPIKEPLVGEKVSTEDRGKRENLDTKAFRPKRKLSPEEAQRQAVQAEEKRKTKLEALRRANAIEEEEDLGPIE